MGIGLLRVVALAAGRSYKMKPDFSIIFSTSCIGCRTISAVLCALVMLPLTCCGVQ